MADCKPKIVRKTWKEFQDTHLLWWINRILHTFGWAIMLVMEDDGTITTAFPIRTGFRGFSEDGETEGYIGVTEYMAEIADELV